MRNNKNSVWVKSGAMGVALMGIGLSGLAMAGPPVSLNVEMDGGCPTSVTDTSNSCPPGLAGPGVACATSGATNVRWTSSNGETITIVFKGAAPEGFSQSNGGNSGSVNGTIAASAAAGSYSYGVKGPTCELDPVIIVTR
jgi:hypothetical protein